MDRDVPPRVTYWTGIWQPSREALSKEVEALRAVGARRATVVSFSAGQRSSLMFRDRVIRLSGRRWLSLRALAAALERQGDITHVFGALDDWHLLRAVGRRPVVFTVALPGIPRDLSLYRKVTLFAAETEPLAERLRQAGVPADRIRVIYPGVDLDSHTPVPPPPSSPFTLLFASSPADPREFEDRGVPLLVEVARRCPDIDVILLWRNWGNRRAAQEAFRSLDPPPNIRLERRAGRPMEALFHAAHATVCSFAAGFGKSCPNSIIEGLACGRPALVTRTCGLADLIESSGAGVATARDAEALAAGLERLRQQYTHHSVEARALAQRCFDVRTFRRSYQDLYERLARCRAAA